MCSWRGAISTAAFSVWRRTVENSILFRGVHVAKGAVVKDSILMSGCNVGENVELSYVVADKNVNIRADRKMMGHATYPVAIAKDAIV